LIVSVRFNLSLVAASRLVTNSADNAREDNCTAAETDTDTDAGENDPEIPIFMFTRVAKANMIRISTVIVIDAKFTFT